MFRSLAARGTFERGILGVERWFRRGWIIDFYAWLERSRIFQYLDKFGVEERKTGLDMRNVCKWTII